MIAAPWCSFLLQTGIAMHTVILVMSPISCVHLSNTQGRVHVCTKCTRGPYHTCTGTSTGVAILVHLGVALALCPVAGSTLDRNWCLCHLSLHLRGFLLSDVNSTLGIPARVTMNMTESLLQTRLRGERFVPRLSATFEVAHPVVTTSELDQHVIDS